MGAMGQQWAYGQLATIPGSFPQAFSWALTWETTHRGCGTTLLCLCNYPAAQLRVNEPVPDETVFGPSLDCVQLLVCGFFSHG